MRLMEDFERLLATNEKEIESLNILHRMESAINNGELKKLNELMESQKKVRNEIKQLLNKDIKPCEE